MNIALLDDFQDCVRHLDCFPMMASHNVRIFNDNTKDINVLATRLADADAVLLMRQRTAISAELLERLPNLRLIVQTGKLGSHVDLAACSANGVAAMEGVGHGSVTAELTWALILASRRHLVEEVNRLRAGQWQGRLGHQLLGKRLGVWSYGRIGKQIAAYGKAFGMNVWVWGREASNARAQADGFEVAPSREAFFANSDVVSVHIRLTPQTRGIVNLADLTLMKKTALFVNTSRAELIQPGALEQALRLGTPGFGAVDVYEDEPVLGATHPLLALPNALCTPHIGFVETENYEDYYTSAFTNILNYAAGERAGVINPEVLQHERQRQSV